MQREPRSRGSTQAHDARGVHDTMHDPAPCPMGLLMMMMLIELLMMMLMLR
jgi:hypothetical protein